MLYVSYIYEFVYIMFCVFAPFYLLDKWRKGKEYDEDDDVKDKFDSFVFWVLIALHLIGISVFSPFID